MIEEELMEELENVALNYPLFAGDTISHAGAAACCRRKWIVRAAGGDWIPTAAGLNRLNEHLKQTKNGDQAS